MSKRELWEQVQVYNVNVGDVIMINTYGHPATIGEGQIDKYGGIDLVGHQLHSHDTVFRRIPDADDPRVLMEALKDLHETALTYAGFDAIGPLEGRIDQARRELESEGNDGIERADGIQV